MIENTEQTQPEEENISISVEEDAEAQQPQDELDEYTKGVTKRSLLNHPSTHSCQRLFVYSLLQQLNAALSFCAFLSDKNKDSPTSGVRHPFNSSFFDQGRVKVQIVFFDESFLKSCVHAHSLKKLAISASTKFNECI